MGSPGCLSLRPGFPGGWGTHSICVLRLSGLVWWSHTRGEQDQVLGIGIGIGITQYIMIGIGIGIVIFHADRTVELFMQFMQISTSG